MRKSLIPVTTTRRIKRTRFILRKNTYVQPPSWKQFESQITQPVLHTPKPTVVASEIPLSQKQVSQSRLHIPKISNQRRAKTIQPFQFHSSLVLQHQEQKQEQKKQQLNIGFYKGNDLHAYTSDLQKRLPVYISDLQTNYPPTVSSVEWVSLMNTLETKFGKEVTPALNNITQYYSKTTGSISSPELPGINFAVLLMVLWEYVCSNEQLLSHFKQTLQDIGTTCFAGVTDRLFADWIAFHPL